MQSSLGLLAGSPTVLSRLYQPDLGRVSTGHRRVRQALLVDDDPDIAVLVETALAPFDIGMDAVTNGREALTRIRPGAYDLIILDLVMPGVDGFDVLQALRRQFYAYRVPVLVLTGDSSRDALARSFGYGADDLVTKPFDAHNLGMRAYRLVYPQKPSLS